MCEVDRYVDDAFANTASDDPPLRAPGLGRVEAQIGAARSAWCAGVTPLA